MLKMLVLKMVRKYINIYKCELSLFGRDDKKQSKSLIFIVVPQVEQPFFKLCLKVLMLLHFFVGLAICSILRDLKKKVSFDQQLFCEMVL